MPYLRLGHELERCLDHADAGAQYRNEPDLVPKARALVRRERSLDLAIVGREVRGRFIEKERRYLGDELAKDLRRRRLVAESRELLPYEGMARDVELFRAQLAVTFSGVIPGTG